MTVYYFQVIKHNRVLNDFIFTSEERRDMTMKKHKERYRSDFTYRRGERELDYSADE